MTFAGCLLRLWPQEADYIGLIMAARACYDIDEAASAFRLLAIAEMGVVE